MNTLAASKGGSGSPMENPNEQEQEHQAPKNHPQHGVEGRAPHTAAAFVAMKRNEERTRGTPTHLTIGSGNRTSRKTTDTRREGPVTTTGPESHKGIPGREGREGGGESRERDKATKQTPHGTNKKGQNQDRKKRTHASPRPSPKEGARQPKPRKPHKKETQPKETKTNTKQTKRTKQNNTEARPTPTQKRQN